MVIAKPSDDGFHDLRQELVESGLKFVRFQRLKKRAQATLSYLSNPGPLLTEPEVLWDIREMGYELDPERDNKSRYDVAGVYHSLSRYGGEVDLSSSDSVILEDAKSLALRAFGSKGHRLEVLPLDSRLESVVKMDKSAGLPSLGKKSDAFEQDLRRAARILQGKTPDPCVAFHRVQHGEEGPKTRLVWGYPQSMTLLESRFAAPLIENFLLVTTPMCLGLQRLQLGARMVRATNAGVHYGLDFSRFDASVPRDLIKFAFSILRTYFEMSDEEEVCWDRVCNYFTFTPIMMPDRSVWMKDHGIPSGSFFTQMVDSIVNYVCVVYAFLREGSRAPAEGEILVLGDDALVGYHEHVRLERLEEAFHELALKLNVVKSKVTFFSREGPAFLGHTWIAGVATRPEEELLKRMAFPEKRSRMEDAKERAATRVLSIGTSAASGHQLIVKMSPYRGNDVLGHYLAIARRGGLSGSRHELTPDLMTGRMAHLEEIGVGERVVAASLGTKLPYTGLLL